MSAVTQKQMWCFFTAASAGASALGLDREEYRHQVMKEEAGKDSLKLIDRCGEFEACMMRMWSDAGDYAMAARYMSGDARRYGRMCEVCAMQIAQLSVSMPGGSGIAYVRGLLAQAGYPCYAHDATWCMDIPAASTHRVFMMLDTHRRRLLRSADWSGSWRFDIDASYGFDADGGTILLSNTPPPAAFTAGHA